MLIREEKKKSFRAALLVVLLAGILGNLLGAFLGSLLPDGLVHDLVSRYYGYGLKSPFSLDLWLFSFSFAFQLRLNSCGLLFMLLGLWLYHKA